MPRYGTCLQLESLANLNSSAAPGWTCCPTEDKASAAALPVRRIGDALPEKSDFTVSIIVSS